MAAAMMTKPTRFLLLSILRRRSPCQSHFLLRSSRRLFCDMQNDSAPFDPTLLKSGDWEPKVSRGISLSPDLILNFDLGRWIVRIDPPDWCKKLYNEKELYDMYVKAVTAVVGSEEEAKERIYLISNNPLDPGFGIYADKKLADKLKDVDNVTNLTPDYYEEARNSLSDTCLVSM